MRWADIEVPNLPVDVDSWGRSACYPRSTFCPLSDGRPTPGRRITRAWFPTCSARVPRSQARLCPCTHQGGCRPPRADLARASVTLWEATAPVKLPTWHGPPRCTRALGRRGGGGGIPRAAPPGLAPRDLRLPPILYAPALRQCQAAVKVHGVFPSLRGEAASSPPVQFRRAHGRDSAQVVAPFVQVGTYPTRNFATLGPVIVTAAVYRGLGSGRRLAADPSP